MQQAAPNPTAAAAAYWVPAFAGMTAEGAGTVGTPPEITVIFFPRMARKRADARRVMAVRALLMLLLCLFFQSLSARAETPALPATPQGMGFAYAHIAGSQETSVSVAWRTPLADSIEQPSQLTMMAGIVPLLGDDLPDNPVAAGKSASPEWLNLAAAEEKLLDPRLAEAGIKYRARNAQPGFIGGVFTFPTANAENAAGALKSVLRKDISPASLRQAAALYRRLSPRAREEDVAGFAELIHFALVFPQKTPRPRRQLLLTFADAPDISLEEAARWRNLTIGRSNLLVAVAGGLSEEAARRFVGTAFGELPQGEMPASAPEEPLSRAPRTVYLRRDAAKDANGGKPGIHAFLDVAKSMGGQDADLLAIMLAGGLGVPYLEKSAGKDLGAIGAAVQYRLPVRQDASVIVHVITPREPRSPNAAERLRSAFEGFVGAGVDTERAARLTKSIARPRENAWTIGRAEKLLIRMALGFSLEPDAVAVDGASAVRADDVNAFMRSGAVSLDTVVLTGGDVQDKVDCVVEHVSDIKACPRK